MSVSDDSIITEARNDGKYNDGDYVKKGLLYCGKCHTPKQSRVPEMYGGYSVYTMCECESMNDDVCETKIRDLEARIETQKRLRIAFPDYCMTRCTFSSDDNSNPELSAFCKNYSGKFELMRKDGKGVLLYGNVGTGKSYAAACIVNELVRKGYNCLCTNFMRIANEIQADFTGRQDYMDYLNSFDLLCADDLFAERDTGYMTEIIYNVTDNRYRAGRPMIITTNLTAAELKKPKDPGKARIISRLFEMCVPFEVKGLDRRKLKLRDNYSYYNTVLSPERK